MFDEEIITKWSSYFFTATQWLDEPINLPILAAYIHPSQQRQPLKVEQTEQLLREFDSVLDAVELTHLTPPQTPPHSPQIENLNDLKLVTKFKFVHSNVKFTNCGRFFFSSSTRISSFSPHNLNHSNK